ncbi:MAG: DUF6502 family protein [Woeseiaceae bacterium]|nr:DUF6502 family protein [Woeseiaceae bacterium]
MENDERLLSALRGLFYPLANLLLKNKVGAAAVVHQLKLAFVEAARDKHGRGGRPAANNMIANLTGMSRRHVGDLLSEVATDPCTDAIALPIESHILSIWCADSDYTDKLGLPRPLDLGPGKGTLRTLVLESTGDHDADEMIERLLQAESIRRRQDEQFELVDRAYMINRDLPRLISLFLSSLASTVDKNWGRPVRDSFTMRVAHSDRLDSEKLAMIRRISKEQLILLLERIDDELCRHEIENGQPMVDENGVELSSVGVGVYYFEKDLR